MKKHAALSVSMIILAILGLADSLYLSYSELTGAALACSINGLDGCNVVAKSIYSRFLGIPLGIYGIGFYGVILILTILLYVYPKKYWYRLLQVIGFLGLIASVVFILIQVFLIKALCVYCLGSAILAFFICIVGIELWKWYVASVRTTPPAM